LLLPCLITPPTSKYPPTPLSVTKCFTRCSAFHQQLLKAGLKSHTSNTTCIRPIWSMHYIILTSSKNSKHTFLVTFLWNWFNVFQHTHFCTMRLLLAVTASLQQFLWHQVGNLMTIRNYDCMTTADWIAYTCRLGDPAYGCHISINWFPLNWCTLLTCIRPSCGKLQQLVLTIHYDTLPHCFKCYCMNLSNSLHSLCRKETSVFQTNAV